MPLYQHVMVGRRMLDLFADLRRRRARPGSSRRARRSTTSCCGSPATTGPAPGITRPPSPEGRPATRRAATGRQRPPGLDPQPGRRRSTGSTAAGLLPAIVFIFSRVGCDAAVAAVPRRRPPADHARGARRDHRVRRGACARPSRRGPARPRLPRLPRRAHPRRRGRTTPGCCRRSSSASRSSSSGSVPRSSSRPRRSRSASTCPPARSCSRSCRSGTARPTPTSRRGSTPSSPDGPVGVGSTSRAMAVVLWQPGMNPAEVAGLASTRTYPLRSCFRPSYNMAVNLVHQVGSGAGPRAAGDVLRPVPGRQGRGRAGAAADARARTPCRATPRPRPATGVTSWSTPRCGTASPTSRRRWRARARPTGARR